MEYSPVVQSHFENPRNVGSFAPATPRVGTGTAGTTDCGDVMKFQIRVDEHQRIAEARFKTFGCAAAIAASSFVTEWLTGRPLDEGETLTPAMITDALSLSTEKQHCSALAVEAVDAARADFEEKWLRPAAGHDA
ncbi:MAG: Fe-S cluster assembly scaffold IscU [Planctomycetes bacterium]|jgi:nitrogen fixation NifU-like protein|nr:Fe-S cluster assembly scaffold IscU [Planctomycetota bacterium]